MTDMGQLHHFLGVSVACYDDSLFLSQRQYTLDILERARMSACKPCSTPIDLTPSCPSMVLKLLTLLSIAVWLVHYSI
jgi:hypothetical protein